MRTTVTCLAALLIHVAGPAAAQPAPAAEAAQAYAPYDYLIGDWISEENGMTIRQNFRWGPARSYIFYSTYTAQPGQPERLHFEGIMVWNGRSGALDYVFAIEPGSGGQEKGSIRAEPDGTIVREVELTAANGNVGQFRQTFRRTGADAAMTSLMRRTDDGWQPNFPGSDRIAMTRRPG